MDPTRRGLLIGGAAAALAAALPDIVLPPAFAESSAAPEPFARTALNRLSFGATLESMTAFERAGFENWLDQQLAVAGDDPATAGLLSEAFLPISYEAGKDDSGNRWKGLNDPKRPLRHLDAAPASFVPLTRWDRGMDYNERERPAQEVKLATLIRAVHAEGQLREVLTQFWHDHFNVNATKDEGCAAYFVLHDRAIRGEALGNFRKLLGSVARSPSMLNYLNNAESRASPANENYARELLELHTLGEPNYLNADYQHWADVPGAKDGLAAGYIDQDVYETARAFTGWSIGDGSDLGEQGILPETGEFHYIAAWHDPYQKRILGREFAPNAPPLSDGETVLDMLASHPGTARFICFKLCRRLLADDPPAALVDAAAARFVALKDSPRQIAEVVKLIALSQEFRAAPPAKMRRPFEFYAGLNRAAGATIRTAGNAFWQLGRAGWRQHEWRPPTGHPDVSTHWANTNTLSTLTQIAINAFEPWFETAEIDLYGGERAGLSKVGDLAAFWSERVLAAKPQRAFVQAVGEAIGNPDDGLAEDQGGRDWQARTVIALAALSPEFMLR